MGGENMRWRPGWILEQIHSAGPPWSWIRKMSHTASCLHNDTAYGLTGRMRGYALGPAAMSAAVSGGTASRDSRSEAPYKLPSGIPVVRR